MYKDESLIRAITLEDDIAKITIPEVPDRPGIAFQLFSKIADRGIRLESIVQNVNRNNINDITFTVPIDQLQEAQAISIEFAKEIDAANVICALGIARLSVIGAGMLTTSKVAAKFFKALYEIGVNIQTISTSEGKISCIIDKEMAKPALKNLYKEFEVN